MKIDNFFAELKRRSVYETDAIIRFGSLSLSGA